MYPYLFGPVPSRRLGMSLSVDLVPKKVCTLNCVYCEVGKTTKLTLERKDYIKKEALLEELEHYFQHQPDPDYITFSGSGEPTLNIHIGDILQYIKSKRPHIPIAVLTNGTLLYDKEVRDAILDAAVVLPSLDAATEKVFRRINRPFKALSLEKCIQGLIDFRKEFKGQIWLEVFILPDYNDTAEVLSALKKAIQKIKPDSVQLNTLDRPGTVANLKAATPQQLQYIADFWQLENVEIITSLQQRRSIASFNDDIETAILSTLTRRPCTLNDLTDILGLHINEINKYLHVLESEGKIETTPQERGVCYQIKEK